MFQEEFRKAWQLVHKPTKKIAFAFGEDEWFLGIYSSPFCLSFTLSGSYFASSSSKLNIPRIFYIEYKDDSSSKWTSWLSFSHFMIVFFNLNSFVHCPFSKLWHTKLYNLYPTDSGGKSSFLNFISTIYTNWQVFSLTLIPLKIQFCCFLGCAHF